MKKRDKCRCRALAVFYLCLSVAGTVTERRSCSSYTLFHLLAATFMETELSADARPGIVPHFHVVNQTRVGIQLIVFAEAVRE